jgi:hypothetical protein
MITNYRTILLFLIPKCIGNVQGCNESIKGLGRTKKNIIYNNNNHIGLCNSSTLRQDKLKAFLHIVVL